MTLPDAILSALTLTPSASTKYLAKVIARQQPDLAPDLRNLSTDLQSLKADGRVELVGEEWHKRSENNQ